MNEIDFFPFNTNPEWCRNHINRIREKNPKDVLKFTHIGQFSNDKYIDTKLSKELFELIPDEIKTKHKLKRAHNVIMTGMYTPGQSFGLHVDTPLYYNTKTREKAICTFLIFLNGDFEGGETQFFSDEFKPIKMYHPEEGYGLIFDLNIWHCGSPVTKGTKYWLHIELIGDY
jgi:hypothetical protein